MENTKLTWLIALTVCFGLFIQSTSVAALEVSITDTGFQPSSVTILAGEGVHWTNNSGEAHSVTADNGLFDSGSLQPGAGFSIATAIPGLYVYQSTNNPDFKGEIHVVLAELAGSPDDLANDHMPDIQIPQSGDDYSPHPDYGIMASRIAIIMGFTDTATVSQANAALVAANVTIRGGLPEMGILFAGAPDTPDFSGLKSALQSLRSDPAVEFAAMSVELVDHVVPRPVESQLSLQPDAWTWEKVFTVVLDLPLGEGANWGIEASRFPQAWNLLEKVRRSGNAPGIRTGVVESGFQEHKDLGIYTWELCTDSPPNVNQECTMSLAELSTNPGAEQLKNLIHGNHVSGIIGATFDNDEKDENGQSLENDRSLGISGTNPVARLVGIHSKFPYIPNQDRLKNLQDILTIFDLAISKISYLKVINYSAGIKFYKYADRWKKTDCGPDPGDDQPCNPNNEDKWLEHAAHWGAAAQEVAERAAQAGIMIVTIAGNESDDFCNIPSADGTGCDEWVRVLAENKGLFAWAGKYWSADEPDPIIVVEAIDQNLELTDFSNIKGDISAPGKDILSTGINDGYVFMDGTSMAAPHVAGLIGYMLAYDPSLTIEGISKRVLDLAREDTSSGASPRLDAFASILSIPGAAKDLVDVNDKSKDGNRRVKYGPGGTELGLDNEFSDPNDPNNIDPVTEKPYLTAPDNLINMRDFRRFRDAWLQKCQSQVTLIDECRILDSPLLIQLDGLTYHPKKDLNFDGCVHVPPVPIAPPRRPFTPGSISTVTAKYLAPMRSWFP